MSSPPPGQETTVGRETAPETDPDSDETAAGVPGVEGVGIQEGNEGEQATGGEPSDGSREGAEALNDGDNRVASDRSAVKAEDNSEGLGWVFYLTVGIGGIGLLILLGVFLIYRRKLAG